MTTTSCCTGIGDVKWCFLVKNIKWNVINEVYSRLYKWNQLEKHVNLN